MALEKQDFMLSFAMEPPHKKSRKHNQTQPAFK